MISDARIFARQSENTRLFCWDRLASMQMLTDRMSLLRVELLPHPHLLFALPRPKIRSNASLASQSLPLYSLFRRAQLTFRILCLCAPRLLSLIRSDRVRDFDLRQRRLPPNCRGLRLRFGLGLGLLGFFHCICRGRFPRMCQECSFVRLAQQLRSGGQSGFQPKRKTFIPSNAN
jgi:hypothetical protein